MFNELRINNVLSRIVSGFIAGHVQDVFDNPLLFSLVLVRSNANNLAKTLKYYCWLTVLSVTVWGFGSYIGTVKTYRYQDWRIFSYRSPGAFETY